MICSECKDTGWIHCGDNNTGQSYPCTPCEQREKLREILTLIDEIGGAVLDEDPVSIPEDVANELVLRGHIVRAPDCWKLTKAGLAYVRWILRAPLPGHFAEEHTAGGRV